MKFSQVSQNNSPALVDYLMGVTSGNVDFRVTVQNIVALILKASLLSNPYKFSANSTGTSVAASTWTKIGLQAIVFDTNGNFDNITNSRYTVPASGYYVFTGAYEVTQNPGEDYSIAVYKNGAEAKRGTRYRAGGSGVIAENQIVTTPPIFLSAGDYVELFGYNGSGGGKSVTAGANVTYFGGYMISAT